VRTLVYRRGNRRRR